MDNMNDKVGNLLGNAAILMSEVAETVQKANNGGATEPVVPNQPETSWLDNWLWLIVFSGEVCLVLILTFLFWVYLKKWVAQKTLERENGGYQNADEGQHITQIPENNI